MSGAGLDDLARTPLELVPGLTPKVRRGLHALGIENAFDLLTYYPRRYVDRTRRVAVAEAVPGEEVVLIGTIEQVRAVPTRHRSVSMVEAQLVDRSGSMLLRFFRQPWRTKQLTRLPGEVAVFGRVELFRRRRVMTNPLVDPIGTRVGQIVPLYPMRDGAGVDSEAVQQAVRSVLAYASPVAETVPRAVREDLDLLGREEALREIHEPRSHELRQRARRRIAFDELFRIQVLLGLVRRERDARQRGIVHDVAPFGPGSGRRVRDLLERLPFPLTGAQERVLREIAEDMHATRPMHRLLQGDVGAGKTLVALVAALFAVQGGHQAAFLAPTEVLAEQHYRSILGVLGSARESYLRTPSLFADGERPLEVALLTGAVAPRRRAIVLERLRHGSIDLVVGTHALLSEGVELPSLGLVVVDEQHRFGVEQRSLLRDRHAARAGSVADTLVMTATPIPRTAAMTVYGDLDLSVIDELPPGRTPIRTTWLRDRDRFWEAFDYVRREVEQGRQAYVVCSLVEESERLAARAAEQEFERLSTGELKGLRLGLVHGRLSSREKDRVMAGFRGGLIDVLVSTTVVEVGVDVTNATVIVIEDADRFGIAQLHQLRGRVGRGPFPSRCFLLAETDQPQTVERLSALERTTDGFALAEVDLVLRGEGTVLGSRQSGRSDLKLASVVRDRDLVEAARRHAEALLSVDPGLCAHPRLARELALVAEPDQLAYLLRS